MHLSRARRPVGNILGRFNLYDSRTGRRRSATESRGKLPTGRGDGQPARALSARTSAVRSTDGHGEGDRGQGESETQPGSRLAVRDRKAAADPGQGAVWCVHSRPRGSERRLGSNQTAYELI
jgi:hypothetical protein